MGGWVCKFRLESLKQLSHLAVSISFQLEYEMKMSCLFCLFTKYRFLHFTEEIKYCERRHTVI